MSFGWIFLAGVLATGTGSAADSGWINVGPGGSTASLPTFDPENPAVMYIGGLGVYRSRDGGVTWSNLGLIGWSVSKVFVYLQNTGSLYAQASFSPDDDTDITKIFKSTDDGATWHDLVTGATLLGYRPAGFDYVVRSGRRVPARTLQEHGWGESWARLSGFPAGLSAYGFAIDWQNHNTLYVSLIGAPWRRAR